MRRGRPLSLEFDSDRPRVVKICSWDDGGLRLSLVASAVGGVGCSGAGTGGGGRGRLGGATTDCTTASFEGGSSPGGSTGEIRFAGGRGKVTVAEVIKGDGRIGCLGDGTCNSGVFIRIDFGRRPAKSSFGESG